MGGAEVYLLSLLEGLAERTPIEVLISDRAPVELARRIEQTGASVSTVRGLARRPSPAATIRLAWKALRQRPALLHVNLSDQGDGLAAIAAASLVRVPITGTLNLVLPKRRRRLERLSRLALRRLDRVIAVSEWVCRYLERQGTAVSLIPYGVATPRERPDARDALGATSEDFVVGGIGRLDLQKGWDVLCASAPRVRERMPRARFVVVGDGPERARLKHMGERSGVDFIGYRERAAELVFGMDVLVVPSRYEAFGLVAAEAILAGVPVVASRVGGLSEVVGNTGILVPANDPQALSEALISLGESPDVRAHLVRQGRLRARHAFSQERMCTETFEVWRRAARVADLSPARVPSGQS